MVGDQAVEVICAIVNCEIIMWRDPYAQVFTPLPVKVRANPTGVECSPLPLAFDAAFVGGYSVLLHETRLLCCCTSFAMSCDPAISKSVGDTPYRSRISNVAIEDIGKKL